MKCRLLPRQQLPMHEKVKSPRTLCSSRNLVIHAALGRAGGLNSDVPLSPCQEVRNGDKDITSGTPEVFNDVVLGPLVSYSNLVYRVDVLDQLQVCAPENFFLPLSPPVEPRHQSALSEGQNIGYPRNLLAFSVNTAHTGPVFTFQSGFYGGKSSECRCHSLQNSCSGVIR